MIGEQLAPGLSRWTAFHEEWGEEVGSVALSRGADRVLIDPLLAPDQLEALEPPAGDLHVVLTIHWHARSAAQILERHPATRVWGFSANAGVIRRRTLVTDPFRPGDPLPGGLQAYLARPRSELVFWDPAARALIPGDALLGDEDGGLRMCPWDWLPLSTTIEQLRENLTPLLELPIEIVAVSHGDPVTDGAREALAAALR